MFGTETRRIGFESGQSRASNRSALVAALAMAVLLTGCGGARVRAADPSPATVAAPAGAAQLSIPRVGSTQQVVAGGAHLSITVRKVIDLPADDDAPVLPGFRGIGVKVEISNTGPAVYDSLVTSDVSIMATDPNVHLLYVPSGPCRTPLRDVDKDLAAGEHRRGCLAFRIHVNARVTEVLFSPHGMQRGQLLWSR